MPSTFFYPELHALIKSFAKRYNTPVFQPHVTIYSGPGTDERCKELLKQAAERNGPISLDLVKIDSSPVFIKTLFITFEKNNLLSELSQWFYHHSEFQTPYSLHPHLSLLYNRMAPEKQRALVSEIELSWKRIEFNWVKAVSSPAAVRSNKDILNWRDIASHKLGIPGL